MKRTSQTGFSVVEALLILMIVGILSFTGWYVYHAKQAADKNYAATDSAPASSSARANNSAGLGFTVKYPSTWTKTDDSAQAQVCTGDALYKLSPASSEIAQAAAAMNANLKHYTIRIAKYTPQDSHCLTDKDSYKDSTFAYLQSSDKLTAGIFKGDSLTFFGSTIDGDRSQLPDTAIISNTNYGQLSHTFTDDAMQTYKGATYQIEVITNSVPDAQEIAPVPLNVTALKGTQLYKDTLAILNSFNN